MAVTISISAVLVRKMEYVRMFGGVLEQYSVRKKEKKESDLFFIAASNITLHTMARALTID